MNIFYSRTDLPVSIFLAGPTPRPLEGRPTPASWRPEAIHLFKQHDFRGSLLVPEDSSGSLKFSYDDQVEWELQALSSATVIMFWIPRTDDMPAFTTNVEFGMFVGRRNVVVGAPPEAQKMKYLQHLCHLHGIDTYPTLEMTVYAAIQKSLRPFQTS